MCNTCIRLLLYDKEREKKRDYDGCKLHNDVRSEETPGGAVGYCGRGSPACRIARPSRVSFFVWRPRRVCIHTQTRRNDCFLGFYFPKQVKTNRLQGRCRRRRRRRRESFFSSRVYGTRSFTGLIFRSRPYDARFRDERISAVASSNENPQYVRRYGVVFVFTRDGRNEWLNE